MQKSGGELFLTSASPYLFFFPFAKRNTCGALMPSNRSSRSSITFTEEKKKKREKTRRHKVLNFYATCSNDAAELNKQTKKKTRGVDEEAQEVR